MTGQDLEARDEVREAGTELGDLSRCPSGPGSGLEIRPGIWMEKPRQSRNWAAVSRTE